MSNMKVNYTFETLESLADHLEERAKEMKLMADHATLKRDKRRFSDIGLGLSQAARVVRNSTIRGKR